MGNSDCWADEFLQLREGKKLKGPEWGKTRFLIKSQKKKMREEKEGTRQGEDSNKRLNVEIDHPYAGKKKREHMQAIGAKLCSDYEGRAKGGMGRRRSKAQEVMESAP